jgi:hypothetical protein
MIFFDGDKVRTKDGAAGIIESFAYDIPALLRDECGDVAAVRITHDCGPHKTGDLITVPVTELEAVTLMSGQCAGGSSPDDCACRGGAR